VNNKKNESKLDVYFREHLVGHLWLDERRRFVFGYDTGWLKQTGKILEGIKKRASRVTE